MLRVLLYLYDVVQASGWVIFLLVVLCSALMC